MTKAMTNWNNVTLKLTMDTVLDFDKMNEIRSNGKSRIPILHEQNENIVIGVMISKSLLNLDVNEGKTVREYYLAKQIRIAPVVFRNMSEKLTDAVSEFEQFKSHFCVVMADEDQVTKVCDFVSKYRNAL
jgi:CBS domain containing-hemolysin-like protein